MSLHPMLQPPEKMMKNKTGTAMMMTTKKTQRRVQLRRAIQQHLHDQPRPVAQAVLQPSFLASEDLGDPPRAEMLAQTTIEMMHRQTPARQRGEVGFGAEAAGTGAGESQKAGPRMPLKYQ